MFDGTPIEIGMVSTATALAMAILSVAYAALGLWLGRPSFQVVSRRALYVNVPLVVLAFCGPDSRVRHEGLLRGLRRAELQQPSAAHISGHGDLGRP